MVTSASSSLRSRGTSLHRQMYLVLRERIVSGAYPPGGLIPREEDLCNQFKVSRITTRRALTDLEAQGLLQRRAGLGTFVAQDVPAIRQPATLSFIEALRKAATETNVEVLGVRREAPPLQVAGQLHLEAGELALHALRLRKKEDIVLMVSDVWIPKRYAGGITAASLKKRALYTLLMSQGIQFGRVIQEISAVPADPDHAAWLGVEVGMPLLRAKRLVYDQTPAPVQYLTLTMSPEHSRIISDTSIDTVDTLHTGQVVHDI